MNIDSIIGNPMVKKMMLGQLKKVMQENAVDLVTIRLNAQGEPDFGIYTEPMTVTTTREFSQLIQDALGGGE